MLTNHVHLFLKTGLSPLATVIRRLLTGYAVSFIGVRIKGDERLLGSSDFVERVLKQANEKLDSAILSWGIFQNRHRLSII